MRRECSTGAFPLVATLFWSHALQPGGNLRGQRGPGRVVAPQGASEQHRHNQTDAA